MACLFIKLEQVWRKTCAQAQASELLNPQSDHKCRYQSSHGYFILTSTCIRVIWLPLPLSLEGPIPILKIGRHNLPRAFFFSIHLPDYRQSGHKKQQSTWCAQSNCILGLFNYQYLTHCGLPEKQSDILFSHIFLWCGELSGLPVDYTPWVWDFKLKSSTVYFTVQIFKVVSEIFKVASKKKSRGQIWRM